MVATALLRSIPVRVVKHNLARAGATALLACLLAGCANLLGLEPWPNDGTGGGSGTGGSSSAGTGGSSGTGTAPPDIDPGGGTGGEDAGIDAGATCASCLATSCASEGTSCQADTQCASFSTCLTTLATCCQEHELGEAQAVTQALYDCALAACNEACDLGAPTCSDCVRNGGESGVDCGGPCSPCVAGKASPGGH